MLREPLLPHCAATDRDQLVSGPYEKDYKIELLPGVRSVIVLQMLLENTDIVT